MGYGRRRRERIKIVFKRFLAGDFNQGNCFTSFNFTCEDVLLTLDKHLLAVEPHAQVDECEHCQVHEHALHEERGLIAVAKPGKKKTRTELLQGCGGSLARCQS